MGICLKERNTTYLILEVHKGVAEVNESEKVLKGYR